MDRAMTEVNRNTGLNGVSTPGLGSALDSGFYNSGIGTSAVNGVGESRAELMARENLANGFRVTQLGGGSATRQATSADFPAPANAYREFAFAGNPDGSLGLNYGVGRRGSAITGILSQGNQQLTKLSSELDLLLQESSDLDASGGSQADKNIINVKIQDLVHRREELITAIGNALKAFHDSLNTSIRNTGR